MTIRILVPALGESVVEATVGQWLKQAGDQVKVGEPLVELETDKVNLEVGAAQSGILARIERPKGADVRIGDVLGIIEDAPAGADGQQATAPIPAPGSQPPTPTPVAKRVADDLGVDVAQVPGSGPRGRVTKDDVLAVAEKQKPAPVAPAPASAPTLPLPHTQTYISDPRREPRAETRSRLSRRRRTIAQRLVEAQHTAAMLTTFNEIDMGAVMDIRARRKESFKDKHGIGLGFMSFFVKASIGALKAFPPINAELQGDELVLKHYYDIGMAVGAEEGLVVPVLRDADRLSFADIEKAIKALAEKAKAGTLALDDLRGGTFTITNGGVFGSLLSTPILNPPQVGILGLHKIEERPIARGGQVIIRPMMYVALSYDHRIVDGREAVQFLARLKELLEDPEALLLEG